MGETYYSATSLSFRQVVNIGQNWRAREKFYEHVLLASDAWPPNFGRKRVLAVRECAKEETNLFDPKLLAFFRQLSTSMPRMIVQVFCLIGQQLHGEFCSTAAVLFESMTRFELICFWRRWRLMIWSIDALPFTCERKSDLASQNAANYPGKLHRVEGLILKNADQSLCLFYKLSNHVCVGMCKVQ